ncbi:MAG: exo-beta-N-acetylmuramidase NamZ domain-containing protein [Candidatus Binataceae bacterium]
MRKRSAALALGVIAGLLFQIAAAAPAAARSDGRAPLAESDLQSIAPIVLGEIEAGRIPGAVVEIGHDGRVVYRRAFGYRLLGPAKVPMAPDTIFDLASLTKVVATTTAVMQLVQEGKLALDSPIAAYWPRFAANGKQQITLRDALTHYSGLPPDLDTKAQWHGYRAAMRAIAALRPACPRDTRYIYSDVNFEALGELVRRVSGQPLDVYCRKHIFEPLAMKDTGFRPSLSRRGRIAPTEYVDGVLRTGEVQDPAAYRMGGVAGHAGLFSTADDLAAFAQMMLDGGSYRGVRILSASAVNEMTAPSSPAHEARLRGLGWDVAPPLTANRYDLPPLGSYGHVGYTGTLLWIDPVTDTYVIILSNRVYMGHNGDAEPLRTRILALVSEALGPVSAAEVLARRPLIASWCSKRPSCAAPAYGDRVLTGADALESQRFAIFKGRRIGLITNQSGVDADGNQLSRVMRRARGVRLAAIFTPEHGMSGLKEGKIPSATDGTAGLPIFSLYGDLRRPSDEMLAGIDALVFDVQDSGARFYTYATTMAYAMEAAARRGIDFYVLDRPNPISASVVEGPVMDASLKSFTGYFPMPTRHGMTIGELAEMFNGENRIGARLHVVRMRGCHRNDWYDQTGLRWVPPSPNLRTLAAATLYPGVGMVEGANVSVGRGTDTPFEMVGAPWIDSDRLLSYLEGRKIAGVRFEAAAFTPSVEIYANRLCHGVRIRLEDRRVLDSPSLGVELIAALYRLYPRDFTVDSTLAMVGSRRVLEQIKSGEDPKSIEQGWQSSLQAFRLLRARYLLY